MANDVIINYGSWTVPSGWNELTLKQFSEIERFYADKEKDFNARDVLEVFTEHSRDELDQLPIEFTESLLEALKWLSEPPQYGEPTNKIVIDGETYMVNVQNKLKTGEYIAFDTVIKQDKHNYAAMLAIICRKEGENYDSKFENEVLPSRVEMFEKAPMVECMRIISFFLTLWLTSENLTQLSSKVEEALSLTAKNIEISRKNGDLSVWSTLLLRRKLKKLRKSMPRI